MGFSFTRRSDVRQQVRRIAIEQVKAALEECGADADFDKTVHGLRRRCKKLRGLLRLIEPRTKVFEAENRAVREAAQGLAGTRDAAVMVETFDALVAFDSEREGGPSLDEPLVKRVGRLLKGRVKASDAADQQHLLRDFAAALAPIAERAGTWRIEGRGFACIGPGLERTYGRMRWDMERARDEMTAEALHDWRKHTKYHWHQTSLLQRAAPEVLGARRDLLDLLGELLGDHHNLQLLHDTLGAVDGAEPVGAVIAHWQDVLAARAFDLGRQLTVEKPAVLRRRFEQYWQLLPDVE